MVGFERLLLVHQRMVGIDHGVFPGVQLRLGHGADALGHGALVAVVAQDLEVQAALVALVPLAAFLLQLGIASGAPGVGEGVVGLGGVAEPALRGVAVQMPADIGGRGLSVLAALDGRGFFGHGIGGARDDGAETGPAAGAGDSAASAQCLARQGAAQHIELGAQRIGHGGQAQCEAGGFGAFLDHPGGAHAFFAQ